jgi:NitT/TauT family transport system substrate-binding protein
LKKSIKIANLIIFAGIILVLLNACSTAVSPADNSESVQTTEGNYNKSDNYKINIGALRGPSALGMINMMKNNKDVEDDNYLYEIVASPDIMTARILSAETDIAVLPTNVASKLYNKGAEIKLAAIVGGGVLYLVSDKNSEIEKGDWSALNGKKIQLIAKGSTPDIVFRYLAENNGLDTDKDMILDYSFDQIELSQMMISGNADIGILPEPFVTSSLKSNQELEIIMDMQEEWGKINSQDILPQTCLIIKQDLIDGNTNGVENFIKKYNESVKWANENPGDAGKLAEELEIGIKESIAGEVIPRCNLMFEVGENARNITDEYLNILYQFSPDDIGGKIPGDEFYYVK